jgi:hypothetical protein
MGHASGTARPIPLWRLRSGPRSSPIDQCSDIAPRTSARLQRLTFHQVPLLAARVVAAAIALAWCSGAVLDRLRLVSARHRRP